MKQLFPLRLAPSPEGCAAPAKTPHSRDLSVAALQLLLPAFSFFSFLVPPLGMSVYVFVLFIKVRGFRFLS